MTKLGNKVKCKVTGFTGIAVTKCIFLNGCIQFAIQAKVNKDGKIPDEKWIDEQQLEYISEGVCIEPMVMTAPGSGGGFRNHPM